MLENPKVTIRIKLATLWASVVFCYLYGDYFELYVPEKVDSLLTGQNILNTPLKLLISSIVLAIPSVMVAGSIILNPGINRVLNIVFGVFFTMITLTIGINSLTKWYSFYVFLAFLESFLTTTIVWYAWKWPRQSSPNMSLRTN